MRKKPDTAIEEKVFTLFLAEQLNTVTYNTSMNIETIIQLLKNAKNEADFARGTQMLIQLCRHQMETGASLLETLSVIQATDKKTEVEKIH